MKMLDKFVVSKITNASSPVLNDTALSLASIDQVEEIEKIYAKQVPVSRTLRL